MCGRFGERGGLDDWSSCEVVREDGLSARKWCQPVLLVLVAGRLTLLLRSIWQPL